MSKLKWNVVSGNHMQVIECTLISFVSSACKPITSFRALSVVYMWPVSSVTLSTWNVIMKFKFYYTLHIIAVKVHGKNTIFFPSYPTAQCWTIIIMKQIVTLGVAKFPMFYKSVVCCLRFASYVYFKRMNFKFYSNINRLLSVKIIYWC